MGLFKSLMGSSYAGSYGEGQEFCEYTEVFGKSPAYITCDMNFADCLPNSVLSCCLKFQMDVYVQENLPTLISESEHAYISMVRASISEHIGGRFVGQGIIGSSGTAFLMFYIPVRQAVASRKMLTEVFMGSFRHVEMDFVEDPEGEMYLKYLYPTELQQKKSNNTKIFKQLRTYGDDGRTPRPIKFFFSFPLQNLANDFYMEAAVRGFRYTEFIAEEPPEGMVLPRFKLTLERVLPFDVDLLERIDCWFIKLAEKYEGEYLFLETDIVE